MGAERACRWGREKDAMTLRQRQMLLVGGLLAVLALRWFDPLGQGSVEQPASAAVERPSVQTPATRTDTTTSAMQVASAPASKWPVRAAINLRDEDLFASRAMVTAKAEAARRPPPPPPQPAYVPPPPPPPPNPADLPPTIQVIGTWGSEPDVRIFLALPQGTVLVKPGDTVLSSYKVQSITNRQMTLVHQATQKAWPIAIPEAPSALKTWPGR
jgi:hypothetical protein